MLDNQYFSEKDQFHFLNDYSNACALVYILVFAWLLNIFYGTYVDKIFEDIHTHYKLDSIYKEKFSEMLNIADNWAYVFSFLGVILSSFIRFENIHNFWLAQISAVIFAFYLFILFIAFHASVRFAFATIIVTLNANRILLEIESKTNNNVELIDYLHADNCFGLKKISELMTLNISSALYYLFGLILIFVTDFLTFKNYGIDNLFHKYPQLCVLLSFSFVFLIILFFIPFMKCRSIVENNKYKIIRHCDELIKERENYYNGTYKIDTEKKSVCTYRFF